MKASSIISLPLPFNQPSLVKITAAGNLLFRITEIIRNSKVVFVTKTLALSFGREIMMGFNCIYARQQTIRVGSGITYNRPSVKHPWVLFKIYRAHLVRNRILYTKFVGCNIPNCKKLLKYIISCFSFTFCN